MGPLSDAEALKIKSGVRATLAGLDSPPVDVADAMGKLKQPSDSFDYLFQNSTLDNFPEPEGTIRLLFMITVGCLRFGPIEKTLCFL